MIHLFHSFTTILRRVRFFYFGMKTYLFLCGNTYTCLTKMRREIFTEWNIIKYNYNVLIFNLQVLKFVTNLFPICLRSTSYHQKKHLILL